MFTYVSFKAIEAYETKDELSSHGNSVSWS